jgi:hypothetical protein
MADNPLAWPEPGAVFDLDETIVGEKMKQGLNWNTPYNARASLYYRDHCFCSRVWDLVTNTIIELTTRPKECSVSNQVYHRLVTLDSREIDVDYREAQAGPAGPLSKNGEWTTFLLETDYGVENPYAVPIHLAKRYLIECTE